MNEHGSQPSPWSARFQAKGLAGVICLVILVVGLDHARAQDEPLIERPPPPTFDDFETDLNKDGIPDGWYNARELTYIADEGKTGPHFVRFQADKPGRPARLSRAFGVDGKKFEAIVLRAWVRGSNIGAGDREGADPSLLIDFLGVQLHHLSRGVMGPWSKTLSERWMRVAKRIPVPPETKDAIMTIGLMGSTGTMDVDGFAIELIPRESEILTTNLVVNGDFELGDPAPAHWYTNNDAHRISPGFRSDSAVVLERSRSRVLTGLGIPVEPFDAISLSVMARAIGLRGGGGAYAAFFFLDDYGQPIPGHERGDVVMQWSGTSAWRREEGQARVPAGAVRAVVQFEKTEAGGSLRIDDVLVTTLPTPDAGAWSPYHVADDTSDWRPIPPAEAIQPASALDFSFLLKPPAGDQGRVIVKDGRLSYASGGRARFWGAGLISPAAFLDPARADVMVDRLARSGFNLVRLGELDSAQGPGRGLFDDTRDDTRTLDPEGLARLDHLTAALKSRGVHIAIELQSSRRFRPDDKVAAAGQVGAGGGPAAIINPNLERLSLETAQTLFNHVNPETKLAWKDEPAVAWITLKGEVSLFNLIDGSGWLPGPYARELQTIAEKTPGSAGRRLWEMLESAHARRLAEALRADHVTAPIAGVSHWRREPEFVASLVGPGQDLIEDRLFWVAPTGISPDLRSTLWSRPSESLAAAASQKRKTDRPYVVGQWCNQTSGAWSFPHEAADVLMGAYTAVTEDWDALVRRGVFVFPSTWGDGPVGTVGGEDIFQIAEVLNGSPHVLAVLPHAASLFHRGQTLAKPVVTRARTGPKTAAKTRKPSASRWDPAHGRLVIDTPHTQCLVGWLGGETATLGDVELGSDNPFAVIAVSSATDDPIASSKRILVTVIGRVEPGSLRFVDGWKRTVADPGRPPFLYEPVRAKVTLRRSGVLHGYTLDSSGRRAGPASFDRTATGDGFVLEVNGKSPAVHWEIVAD